MKVDNAHAAQVSYKASCPPGPKIPSKSDAVKCGVSHASLEIQEQSLDPFAVHARCGVKIRRGEPGRFEHMLDMVGHGWAWSGIINLTTPQY